MYKSIISVVVALAMVAITIPAFATISSDTVPASNAWHYDGYRVERLNFDGVAVDGPLSIGEHVVIAVSTGNTAARDIYFLNDGGYIKVEDVPTRVISESVYSANDNRFVWAEVAEIDTYRFNVIELDPATGEKNTIFSNLFFNGAQSVNVHVEGDFYYFTLNMNFNSDPNDYSAEVFWYDPIEHDAVIIERFNNREFEVFIDTYDDLLMTKMVFPSGEEQLWIYQGDFYWAIPNSWTATHEDIEAAHFTSDGQVEFFRQYERHLYNLEASSTEVTGQYLNWDRPITDVYQVTGHNLAWLNEKAELLLSVDGKDLNLGEIGLTGMFRLEDNKLFYDADGTGTVYNLATGEEIEYDFVATDGTNGVMVGVNSLDDIVYYNDEYDILLTVGYGAMPLVTDAQHIYWMGSDENIYEATIDIDLLVGATQVRAMKSTNSNTVYLIDGKDRYAFQNEKVFYSWFDNFDQIEVVSQAKLSEYADAGEAFFQAGTKVKIENDPKVYTVGYDGKLHWIISQAVAFNIYGNDWNQDIIEINLMDLVDYSFGINITSEADAELI
ncbi:MAG: hypothetical protein ABIH67_03935 [Candidatus Uhrbacteria bacterium]